MAPVDDKVIHAMAKWPNVPNVFGWLSLDRRGRWLLQGDPVLNRAAIAFINRNYAADDQGRWYFQNGPQRVFVRLAYTPWVYRSAGPGGCQTHTGIEAGPMREVLIDEHGDLLVVAAPGIGLVDDRDLPGLADRIETPTGDPFSEEMLSDLLDRVEQRSDTGLVVRCEEARLDLRYIGSEELARKYGFVQEPC